ncbi:MAG: aryl-sulfate sulfotransferase [Candidatus Eiseniibacteriota bacterium]
MRRFIHALRARRGCSALAAVPAFSALAVFLLAAPAFAGALPGYDYVSPMPGSSQVSPGNTIALRRAGGAMADEANAPILEVVGSLSGAHAGSWRLSDDRRTRIFVPSVAFAPGERVRVSLRGPQSAGPSGAGQSFEFVVSDQAASGSGSASELGWGGSTAPRTPSAKLPAALERVLSAQPCDTMPTGLLPATLMSSNNPDPGCVFLSLNNTAVAQSPGHLTVLDNFAVPLFHRPVPGGANDLSVQPNGLLTYFATTSHKYYALDSTYALVDSFATGNGYTTDGHDLRLLPNGHALLMSYDPQKVGMDTVVVGGNPNSTVTGLIIQELDASKNVVFQWRSWDHFKITDMIEVPGRSLTDLNIDYVHGNSVEADLDGNILISSRHMDEVTKIDRQTGDIIWRLGLNAKNNQFAFVGDTKGSSHQHDVRRLPNGHITMYDNGDYMPVLYSRALEYSLDETNRIATEVWEYRNTPDLYGFATGSVRRRGNGATMIGWGLHVADPQMIDLHADGSKALEFGYGDTLIFSYRAQRYDWRTTQFIPDAQSLDFGTVGLGSVPSRLVTIHNNTSAPIDLTCFSSSDPTVTVAESVPLTLPAGGDRSIHVRFSPTAPGPVSARLYLRSVHGTELVAQPIAVSGAGSSTAGAGSSAESQLWIAVQPNPGRGARTLVFGLPAAGFAKLEIFDLGGRRMAVPFAAWAPAGRREITWDGTGAGAPVRGGLYFARITTAAGSRTSRVVQLDR